MTTHAIILAGGKGERLRPHTLDRPKPMVEVGGRPIVSYQIEQMRNAGIDTIVFACSYKHDFLMNHWGSGDQHGINALYSVEDTPLGRGGAIKQAMTHLPDDWQNVVVANGDNLWKLDIADLTQKHTDQNALVTMVVSPLKSPYGIVEFDEDGHIQAFREKPVLPHWINAGAYILSRETMPLLPDIGDHETEMFPYLPQDR